MLIVMRLISLKQYVFLYLGGPSSSVVIELPRDTQKFLSFAETHRTVLNQVCTGYQKFFVFGMVKNSLIIAWFSFRTPFDLQTGFQTLEHRLEDS
jgi:hypothetical protein